jgi:secreted PhoX family phosphatase
VFVKSIKLKVLMGTLIGIMGLFISGRTPSTLSAEIADNSYPAKNITMKSLTNPEGIALDPRGNIWITNYNNDSVSERDPNGKPLSPSGGFTGGGLNKPLGIVIDSTGNVWVANYGNNSITKLNSSGQPLSPASGFTGGGLNKPLGIVIDSTGNVWVANYGNNSITRLNSSGKPLTPTSGLRVNGLKHPYSITIDSVGNVWVANEGNSITEMIGAAPNEAAPVISGSRFDTFLNQREKIMETLTLLGAEMLPNELTLLKVIVAFGFVGWMMLLLVQAVWLDSSAVAKNGLDEYGGHYSKKHGGYHCVTGRFAGKSFANKEEMLKLAA